MKIDKMQSGFFLFSFFLTEKIKIKKRIIGATYP